MEATTHQNSISHTHAAELLAARDRMLDQYRAELHRARYGGTPAIRKAARQRVAELAQGIEGVQA